MTSAYGTCESSAREEVKLMDIDRVISWRALNILLKYQEHAKCWGCKHEQGKALEECIYSSNSCLYISCLQINISSSDISFELQIYVTNCLVNISRIYLEFKLHKSRYFIAFVLCCICKYVEQYLVKYVEWLSKWILFYLYLSEISQMLHITNQTHDLPCPSLNVLYFSDRHHIPGCIFDIFQFLTFPIYCINKIYWMFDAFLPVSTCIPLYCYWNRDLLSFLRLRMKTGATDILSG